MKDLGDEIVTEGCIHGTIVGRDGLYKWSV